MISGKTLIMAGLNFYLYEQGYRNFPFSVNSTNITMECNSDGCQSQGSGAFTANGLQASLKDRFVVCRPTG